jgi:aminopeptidase-like protein
MTVDNLSSPVNPEEVGAEIHALITGLFPICRSITGDGFRQTLAVLQGQIPLTIHEVPSGTQVFDWIIPKEWNIRDAYVKNAQGEKVIDFQQSNLHVLNYSLPVNKTLPLAELKAHLFTLPDQPDLIPYKTAYYQENWGFCLSHNTLMALEEGNYEVYIDATLAAGSLTYGELYLPGAVPDEVLISCHCCHPSLANDNLSGIGLATLLAKMLQTIPHRLSYRFVFIPGTIGAITWLARNESQVNNIMHGLVVTGVGDAGKITYKKSRRGNAAIDKAVAHILKHSGQAYDIIDFYPYGYDERQYCSPAFNLPVGCLMRTPYGQYPEYHTSADNLDFVKPESLGDSFSKLWAALNILENNQTYLNLSPKCEPQLGKRGLYSAIGTHELALLWVLNLSDGANSLLDIAERSGMAFTAIQTAAKLLLAHDLLQPYLEYPTIAPKNATAGQL